MLINLLPLPVTSTLAKVVHSYRFVMLLTKCMLIYISIQHYAPSRVLLRLKHSVVGDVGGDGFAFCGVEEVGRWAEWVLVVLDGCPAYKLHA